MDGVRALRLVARGNPRIVLTVAALLALALTALAPPVASAQGAPPEPESYRVDDYRAPTPNSLKGARTISNASASDLGTRPPIARWV